MEKKPKISKTSGTNDLNVSSPYLKDIARSLSRKIMVDELANKAAPALPVLALVGAGAFLAASVAIPTLPQVLKPFLSGREDKRAWKRYNLDHLKRTLNRLEKRQLIRFEKLKNGEQIVTITKAGQTKLLRLALNETTINKPAIWSGDWYLISYDIPEILKDRREALKEYLRMWNFYPLHESMFLHAYPCLKEVDFLREYLGIGEHVRVFVVRKIENDHEFREFFGI